jgi:hypothetical protein
VDDVIVYGKNFTQHLQRLDEVLTRLEMANIKMKPSKCRICQTRVKFLGRIISAKGCEVNPESIQKIEGLGFPRDITQLRAFLGVCSYYRSYCPRFGEVAAPLTDCLRKGETISWTDERGKAFASLKSMLTSAPVLGFFDDEGEVILDVDASLVGAGAVLQQRQNGVWRVIEYASRVFSRAERNYCVTRREMTALVFGLTHFRQFLLGRKFTCRVDHSALAYYQKTPSLQVNKPDF